MKRILPLVLILALILSGCKSGDYKQAQTLMDGGDYTAAKELLDAIPDYKDAAELSARCQTELDYIEAGRLFDAGDYAAALDGYEALGPLYESEERAAECRRHVDYMAATALADSGQWSTARDAFAALGDFLDAPAQAARCRCEVALADAQTDLDAQRYLDALDLLDTLPDEPAYRERAAAIRESCEYGLTARAYDNAVSLFSGCLSTYRTSSDPWQTLMSGVTEAADKFTSFGDFKSAPQVAAALNALVAKDYAAFADALMTGRLKLGGMFDLMSLLSAVEQEGGLSVEELLSLLPLHRSLTQTPGNTRTVQDDILYYNWSQDLDGDVFSLCGANPDGKLLIYVTRKTWDGDPVSPLVPFSLMADLPAGLLPSSLGEVGYVLQMAFGYEYDGAYDTGTQGIREYVDMTLYSVPGKKTVKPFSRVYGDHAPDSFTSYGILAYKSGGDPDRSEMADNVAAVIQLLGG